ncbi:MAG TPA: SDR family oxidoreductase [Dehalococcoidia bacterium]|jgi:NAD(P)-dependent dehydrogenase (short-subunit alcohol dehydrogenase family)|nr:SDR family oxidoreductase [Dehalococcoidia bacterium]
MNADQMQKADISRAGLALAGAAAALGGLALASRVRRGERLSDQVALITGGSRGLGFLLARELTSEGCRVAICARDPAELERARQELAGAGADVLAVLCDVGERGQVERMVARVNEHYGRIDVLINNAGIIQVGPLDQMRVEDFQQALDVMFWGVVYPTLAVLPQMRARRSGRILTITSIGGKVSVPHLLPYGAAKFAAVGFSEGLRAELAREGITVTTIAPGLMRTGSHLNAGYKGKLNREFTWMSLGASLPVISMDAERAARQIVRALKRGEAERVLTVPARLLALFHGVAPGTTANILALVDRWVLPAPGGTEDHTVRGVEIEERYPSPLRDRLTGLGRTAAERFHERPGPVLAATGGAERGREA